MQCHWAREWIYDKTNNILTNAIQAESLFILANLGMDMTCMEIKVDFKATNLYMILIIQDSLKNYSLLDVFQSSTIWPIIKNVESYSISHQQLESFNYNLGQPGFSQAKGGRMYSSKTKHCILIYVLICTLSLDLDYPIYPYKLLLYVCCTKYVDPNIWLKFGMYFAAFVLIWLALQGIDD